MRFASLFLFCIASGFIISALSQKGAQTDLQIDFLYRQADSLYGRALALSRQHRYDEREEERLNRRALTNFVTYFERFYKVRQRPDAAYFFAAVKTGELEHYFDSLPQALRFYNLAIQAKAQLPGVSDTLLFKPYILAGLIYIQQNKLDSALSHLKKAESIQQATGRRLPESERLFNNLGGIYFEYGNYRQAKNYFQKAADVLTKDNPSYSELYVNYKLNLATVLFKLEDYDAATALYQDLLNKSDYLANQIYNNLGLIQLYRNAPQRALFYFKKVAYHSNLAIGLNNDVANAYLKLGRFDSSLAYLTLATEANKKYNASNPSVDYGQSLKLFGDLYTALNDPAKALLFYQRSFRQFYPSYTDTNTHGNPQAFAGAFSYINLFQALVGKANAWELLYRKNGTGDAASHALEAYRSAFRLIAYVEKTYESDEARLFLTKIKYAVHSKPIDLAFDRYTKTGDKNYLSLLYQFDQQNKAAVLTLNQKRNLVTLNETAPQYRKAQQLRAEITRLSIRASRTSDSAALAAINASIRDYEIALAETQSSSSAKQEAIETDLPSIKQLQEDLLDAKTVLVSYHLSPDNLTTLVVTKQDVACYQQALPVCFAEMVQREINRTKGHPPTINNEQSDTLRQLLLNHLPLAGMEQLIVIPDDVLAYLSFESLQRKNGRYLVQDVSVQYQFSTALLLRSQTDFSGAETLSFAPFTQSVSFDGFPPLPGSAEEVSQLRGRHFLGPSATKENFLRYCNDYPVVHLATHAVMNAGFDNLAYVVFSNTAGSDNRLYAQEIFNLHVPKTQLVILSACETGSGRLIKGEGVLSLSRAFAYAGCPNIVTSLWKADDFSTAYLTQKFHGYLNKGRSIANALQLAKLDYLGDKTVNPRLKQPYYWAHLVFVGRYQPAENSWRWVWLLAAIPLCFGIYVVRRLVVRRRKG